MSPRTLGAIAIAAVASTTLANTAVPQSTATPAADNVVISEVYGGGATGKAAINRDFIELYNPTDADIDVSGWSVEYFSAKGGSGGTTSLEGVVPAGGYYLIAGDGGDTGAELPEADADGSLKISKKEGSVVLTDGSGNDIDLVGFGGAAKFEGSPAGQVSSATSASRDDNGTDTDDNSADFAIGDPTPTNSGNASAEPAPGAGDDDDNGDQGDGNNTGSGATEAPESVLDIAEIQGAGPASPLVGKTVTTRGVVTASYPEGGLNGYMIQTAGTGTKEKQAGDASDGIFVYSKNTGDFPEIGEFVEVTGKVAEFKENTQLTDPKVKTLTEEHEDVTPVAVDTLPAGDDIREAYESMLIQPGTHTVTNNYGLNRFGEIGLAPGEEAFRQPSDIYEPSTDPDSPLQKLTAEQKAKLVTLDDGRTGDYTQGASDVPLPYLAQDNAATIKPLRTTDHVEFQHPVVVNYSFDQWRLQPTSPVTGDTAGADLPITWEDSRPAELNVPDQVKGDYTISAFNVLNYFTTLGADKNCGSFKDRAGNPVTAKDCDVRGAYSQEAFGDQERKIVAAINGLNADVIALSEIENGYATTGDKSQRDKAVNHLVDRLNEEGGNWAAVKSPSDIPVKGDAIRTAFIYNPDRVAPVGESRIFSDERFTGTAREPLAQEFAALDDAGNPDESKETFVAVANHFKSKGSVAKGDKDSGDGQGNNPNVRNAQAQAVLDHLQKQDDWKDKATFVMGDLNTYSKEDALNVFRTAGYSVPAEEYGASTSYQFDGLLGTLDHVLTNQVATGKLQDAQVWDINADESIAFEYSRRNYNAVDFYDDSPFRSSDHDPVKVGFRLDAKDTADNGASDNGQENADDGDSNQGDANQGENGSDNGTSDNGQPNDGKPNDGDGSNSADKPSTPGKGSTGSATLGGSAILPLLGGLGLSAAIFGILPFLHGYDDPAHRLAVHRHVAGELRGHLPRAFHGFADSIARDIAAATSGWPIWDFLRK